MTIAQIEQRLLVLEQTVRQIQAQLARPPEAPEAEEDFIPGAEYDFTPTLMPYAEIIIPAKIVVMEEGSLEWGLSDEEWTSLPLEL
jgi:hypothetical protein